MIQIDGPRRHNKIHKIPGPATNERNIDRDTGTKRLSTRKRRNFKVRIEEVGLGMRRVRVRT